jgi:hypothetical protein
MVEVSGLPTGEFGHSRQTPIASLAKREVLANMCHFWHNED